mmetsp:Transcript_499/g.289  ORF Transcript_499/g.289 Transcript_499/m.289 type:complete len:224 (+) Transcript_499:164-835(+)
MMEKPSSIDIKKAASLTSILSFCYGISSMLTWNSILSTVVFYESLAPSYQISFMISACYFSFFVVVSVLIIPLGHRVSFYKRVHTNLLIQAVLFCSVPFLLIKLSYSSTEKATFTTIVVFLIMCGILVSILNSSLIGFCSSLAPRNITLFSTGMGLSGLISNLIRILLLMIYPEDNLDEGQYVGVFVFYSITIACCLLLASMYFFEKSNTVRNFYIQRIEKEE